MLYGLFWHFNKSALLCDTDATASLCFTYTITICCVIDLFCGVVLFYDDLGTGVGTVVRISVLVSTQLVNWRQN